MDSERLLELLNKYKDNTLSELDYEELEDWYRSLSKEADSFKPDSVDTSAQEMLKEFREKRLRSPEPVRKMWRWQWVAAAAAIFVVIIGGGYFLANRNVIIPSKLVASDTREKRFKNEIGPGKHKAVLTLSNGQKLVLDSALGIIARQGSISLSNRNGLLSYKTTGNNPVTEVSYNTLTTSKGETYPLKLSDGTMVWLNSSSSIHFPLAFVGNERKVTITGEAYFEVAKDAAKPFRVRGPGDDFETEVLGTHFNVNTYNDEGTLKVTLLEGSVKVNKGATNVLLKPGQQAQVGSNSLKVVSGVDVDHVVAWKDGLFNFNNADIREIMQQAARWYDIEVVYEGNVSAERFKGKVSRNAKLTELLKILELTDVRFIIDGKKITVIQ